MRRYPREVVKEWGAVYQGATCNGYACQIASQNLRERCNADVTRYNGHNTIQQPGSAISW
jgi:hypothetical protein